VDRVKGRRAAAILAVTRAGELVLVEQYRIPMGKNCIELPAGLVGDRAGEETEDLLEAARRELFEEAGFEAERMEVLLEGPSSPGMSSETVALVLAEGLRKTGPGGGVDNEAVRVHLVPLAQVHDWIEDRRREGCEVDVKLFSGLYYLQRQRKMLF
jgi:ADP-ribose pyrophosphatase